MKLDRYLEKFLLDNQDIFINIFDITKKQIMGNEKKIKFYPFGSDGKIDSLLVISKQNIYFKTIEAYFNNIFNIINSMSQIFSIYSNSKSILSIEKNINMPIRIKVDYFVMKLDKQHFISSNKKIDGFECIRCYENHFEQLKHLQYFYHVEEVYSTNDYYPYKTEMSHFKKTLKEKINFAVFKKRINKAVSKIYINAESPDAYQIGGVYTLKEYRKKGLSLFCLSTLFSEIFQTNKKYIFLFVNQKNIAAINLYKKLGFTIISKTSTLYF